jgi:AraC-like DNA-binding protein
MSLVHADRGNGTLVVTLLGYAYFAGVPLLYGYVKVLTQPSYIPGARDLIHFLPVMTIYALLISGIMSEFHLSPENLAMARGGWPPSALSLMSVFLYFFTICYLLGALVLLRSYRDSIAGVFSYQEKITLRWLRLLLLVYLALSALGLVIALVRLVPGVELWPRSHYSMMTIIAIYYLIAFMGMAQPAVFASGGGQAGAGEESITRSGDVTTREVREDEPEQESVSKYETSALTPARVKSLWETLDAFMLEKKPYLDNELRIADLAGQVNIPAHHLSQVINQHAGRNFFEFVNHYRVEEAMRLLGDGQLSMTAIAFESGFNSQSAFYRHFKKVTGLTPKQYQRQSAPTAGSTD